MGGSPLHYLVAPLRTSGQGGDKERPSKGQGGNSEDCTDNEDTQMCSLMLIPITLNVECRLYIYIYHGCALSYTFKGGRFYLNFFYV